MQKEQRAVPLVALGRCGLAQIRGLFDLCFVSKNDHSSCCPPQAGTALCLLSVCSISPSTSPKVFKESTLKAWDSYWDIGHMTHYLLLSAAPSIIPVSSPPNTTERTCFQPILPWRSRWIVPIDVGFFKLIRSTTPVYINTWNGPRIFVSTTVHVGWVPWIFWD